MYKKIKEDVLFKLNEVCKNLVATNTPEELSRLFFRGGEPNIFGVITSEAGTVPNLTYENEKVIPRGLFRRMRTESDIIVWLDGDYAFTIKEVVEFVSGTTIHKIYYK